MFDYSVLFVLLASVLISAMRGLVKEILSLLGARPLCGMTSMPQPHFWKHALFPPWADSGARTFQPFLPVALAQHVHF